MKIEIEDNQFIEFDESQRLFFYGHNQKLAHELVRSLKRFSNKKNLNELEELVYGENGIEIYRDEQLLKPGSIDIHFLQDSSSIYNEVSFDKLSLMTDFLSAMSENVEINRELSKIEDHLLKIELIFNEKLGKISDNISSNVAELTYAELMKNNMFLSYVDQSHEFPLEMMDANELIDEYLLLLKDKLARDLKETWVVLINIASFLSLESSQVLIDGLTKMADDTGLLHIFIVGEQSLNLHYDLEDIPNTVILTNEVCQMPEFENFKSSVMNHYPATLRMTDEELCSAFFEIISCIGNDINATGKSYEYIVLLKVINDILGFSSLKFNSQVKELTDAERAYLES